MALQRSKSAPHGVPGLLPPAPSALVRAASFHTVEQVVKDTKVTENREGDAFNLWGFFPRENGWGAEWGRREEKRGMHDGGSLFGASDKVTREAIKDEDKLGVLSLGRLLGKLVIREEEEEEEKSVRRVSQVLDEETVWQRYREERAKVSGEVDGDISIWRE